MSEYKCKLCEIEFDNYKSLSRHNSIAHGIKSDAFYVDFYLNGMWPLCKCGCGGKVKWSYGLKSFCELCKGHYSRIHNNWGHNKKCLEKSLETRIKRFNSGELTTWNSGLSKETDERVKNNGLATSIAFTQDRKNKYSRTMKENRLNGTIPTLNRSNHSQWKGGISNIYPIVYADRRLYKEWKYPILVRDGFKCVKCGSDDKLHIHHDKEYMTEIIKKHMVEITEEMLKDFEIKKLISDTVVDYHINNKVSGITLCHKCHNELHPSLNFK